MSSEIKGRVIEVLPEQTGQGKKGQWRKTEFIIETKGQYPKKVCLSIFGDKRPPNVGDELNVQFDLESREYNGRWYTEAKAWKYEVLGAVDTNAQRNEDRKQDDTSSSTDDLPF